MVKVIKSIDAKLSDNRDIVLFVMLNIGFALIRCQERQMMV